MKKILFLSLMACTTLMASEPLPKHEHRVNLGILNLGYEHIKPDAIYAGIDAKLSSLWLSQAENNYSALKYLNAEFRLGYNITFGVNDTITPYLGAGHTFFDSAVATGNIRHWTYGSAGMRYLHDFGNIFSAGFHIKATMSVIEKSYDVDNGSNISLVSYQDLRFFPETGLTLVWHFGDNRNWEINLEPYYAQIPNRTIQHTLGSKLLLGCRY